MKALGSLNLKCQKALGQSSKIVGENKQRLPFRWAAWSLGLKFAGVLVLTCSAPESPLHTATRAIFIGQHRYDRAQLLLI